MINSSRYAPHRLQISNSGQAPHRPNFKQHAGNAWKSHSEENLLQCFSVLSTTRSNSDLWLSTFGFQLAAPAPLARLDFLGGSYIIHDPMSLQVWSKYGPDMVCGYYHPHFTNIMGLIAVCIACQQLAEQRYENHKTLGCALYWRHAIS
jgi:hypothetical protein